MNANLRLSPAGAHLIQHFESCLKPIGGGKYRAYLDPVKVLSIGWGHTNHHGRKFKSGAIWSQRECDDEFLSDMARFEGAVKRLISVELSQNQFDALVSFTFNVGEGNLSRSTLRRILNEGDYVGAAQEFRRFNKAKGKVLKGLVRRRGSESLMFQDIPDPGYTGRPGQRVAPRPQDMPHEVDEPPQSEEEVEAEAQEGREEIVAEPPPAPKYPAGTVRELQAQVAAKRKLPLAAQTRHWLNWAAKKTQLYAEVTSGGQARKGTKGPRTGSTRHDLGGAADLRLRDPKNGALLDMRKTADAARMEAFMMHAVAAGATGVGAGLKYMGAYTMHIGGGTAAHWGGAAWVARARRRGVSMRKQTQAEMRRK